MTGANRQVEMKHTVMKICALFANLEDEDVGRISDALVLEKIKDWENVAVMDFYELATICIQRYDEFKDVNLKINICPN